MPQPYKPRPNTTDEPLPRKPRSELRHWTTYSSVDEWFRDYRGYVPIQIPHAISQLVHAHGCTFVVAYRSLLHAGKIIHLDPADDIEP